MKVIQSVALVCALLVADVVANTCGNVAKNQDLKCEKGYNLKREQECGGGEQFAVKCRKGGLLTTSAIRGEACCIEKNSNCGDLVADPDNGYVCGEGYNVNKNLMCGPNTRVDCYQQGEDGRQILSQGGPDDKKVCCVQASTCGAEVDAHEKLFCPEGFEVRTKRTCGNWTGRPCWIDGGLNPKCCRPETTVG